MIAEAKSNIESLESKIDSANKSSSIKWKTNHGRSRHTARTSGERRVDLYRTNISWQ